MSGTSTQTAGPSGGINCLERRAKVRHASTMEASYHPIAVPAVGPCCPARIWDISLDGIALVVPHPYEPGSVLAVVPEVLPQSLAPALEARVLYVKEHGDGLWMAGCEFLTPLGEDELHALLY
jgi:hypothetical protein